MKKIILSLLLLIQFSVAATSLTSGFEFLRTDFNTRTAAMGSSYLTLNGDAGGLFINPAGLANIQQQNFGFNYMNHILDINGGNAVYNRIFPKIGVLTAGITYMDYGEFTETNDYAEPTGNTFSAHDFAFVVGIANHLDEQFSYGVNLKYIYSKLEDFSASAMALDFGLLYRIPYVEDLLLGVTLTNMGTNFSSYEDTKEQLPLRFRVGVSKKLAHLPLEISASLNDMNMDGDIFWDRLRRFAVGGEFKVNEMFRLRLGYDHDLHYGFENSTTDKFGGVSGGFGIYWNNYRFDYAYSSFSVLGNIHRIGFSGSLP